MSTTTNSSNAKVHGARQPTTSFDGSATGRALLWCGALIGPVFYSAVAIQAVARVGYDITRHPISLLSLGNAGWIQIVNFIACGLLGLGFAAGARRVMQGAVGATWIPLLVATFGVGMIIAGIFPPDPLLGFPPGTPNSIPPTMSTSAMLHGAGFFVAFGALTAACFVFAKRCDDRRRWRGYSVATGLAIPIVIGLGMALQAITSIAFALVGVIAFGWLAAVACSLLDAFHSRHS